MSGVERGAVELMEAPGGEGALPGARRPRLGFLGVGWIGRNRMEAIAGSGVAEVAVLCDPSPEMRAAAIEAAPGAEVVEEYASLLEADLDGVVIATPSARHAEQAIAALERGLAVFCQKPLGRTAEEVRGVVEAARRADRLLGVDLSYRSTEALAKVREGVLRGEIGRVFAADLVFHNAYGPDKSWFYDPAQAGGGCVMDLGIHLIDALLWVLGFPEVERAEGRLLAGGSPLPAMADRVEDFATADLRMADGATARIACSWNLPAGQDAVISATFYGTQGGYAFRNVGGSFYDFVAERYRGTATEVLVEPPDAWGGRAAVAWARRLATEPGFDSAAAEFTRVAETLDRIYGR